MCDNEAFEFTDALSDDEESIGNEPATAREVSIVVVGGGQVLVPRLPLTPRCEDEAEKLPHAFREIPHSRGSVTQQAPVSGGVSVLQQTLHPPQSPNQPFRSISAGEAQLVRRSDAELAIAVETDNRPTITVRKATSANPSGRRANAASAVVDSEAAMPMQHVGLASQLAAALTRAPPRLSFVDRARAYRQQNQLSSSMPDSSRVFGQILEPVAYCGEASADNELSSCAGLSPLLTIEKLHNLMAERRHLTAIVDCREDSETSRLDLSHLVTFSASDLLEADCLQLERINKSHRFLVLVSNLATCPKEDLIDLRECLVNHLQLGVNSCGMSVHVLDCDVNHAAYLGSSGPVPTVFEDSIYLMPEHQFAQSNDSLSLYESVLTDSKSVEKFCHFQATKRVSCLRISSFTDDVEAALWLIKRTEERNECAMLCFSSLNLGKALVVAYTMWKHRHLMRDAVQRVRDACAVVELDSTREKELLDIEKRLFCSALA